jgi:hypothetical protein
MMNKFLFGGLFAVMSSLTQAQTIGEYECLPKELGGSGSAVYKFVKDKDVSWSWICGLPGDISKLEVAVRLDGYNPLGACLTGLENAYHLVLTLSREELVTIANQVFNICKQPPASADVERYKYVVAQAKNYWFPTVEYVVRSNGLYLTRPAYPLANGVRITLAQGTAKVGEKCDPNVAKVGAPPNVYMAFGPNFDSKLVALCSIK